MLSTQIQIHLFRLLIVERWLMTVTVLRMKKNLILIMIAWVGLGFLKLTEAVLMQSRSARIMDIVVKYLIIVVI